MKTKNYYTGSELKQMYEMKNDMLNDILNKLNSRDLGLYWKIAAGYYWDVFEGNLIDRKFYINK